MSGSNLVKCWLACVALLVACPRLASAEEGVQTASGPQLDAAVAAGPTVVQAETAAPSAAVLGGASSSAPTRSSSSVAVPTVRAGDQVVEYTAGRKGDAR